MAVESLTTINVTTAVAQFTTSTLQTAQSSSSLMWAGVDVFDVDIRMRKGKMLFLDSEELRLGLETELADISEAFAGRILESAGLLSLSVPWLEVTDSDLYLDNGNASGFFLFFQWAWPFCEMGS